MNPTDQEGRHLQRYGVALIATFAAFAIDYVTWPLLKPAPWALFITAVMTAAWNGGLGPGLVATAVASILGQYFLFEPIGSFNSGQNSLFRTLVFMSLSLVITFLISAKRTAERIERIERMRSQATVMSIGDAVIATDARGRVTFMNGVAERLTGWAISESLRKPLETIFQVVIEKSQEQTPSPADKSLESSLNRVILNQRLIISKDGRGRRIEHSAAPIVDDAGFTVGSVVTFRDVTERRLVEQQLRRFAFLAEQSTDFIGMCDLEGVPFFVNPAGLETVGLESLEEAKNVRVVDFFFPEDQRFVSEKFFPEVLARGNAEVEIRFRHFKTGEALWMAYNVLTIKDEAGRVAAYATISKNVTERKRIEAELRDARIRLEAALLAGATGTWTWDVLNDRVVADSRLARLFSVSPEDANGGPIASYLKAVHPVDRERVSRVIGQVVASGTFYDEEYRLIQSDGSIRWVGARGRIERNADGRAITLPGVVVDITERKRAQEERQEIADQLASHARAFDTVLSNTEDFNYTFDLQGRFTYINRALLALWRKEAHDAVGKNFFELGYPVELAERLQRQIQHVIDTKNRVVDETPFTSAHGTRYYEYIFVPVLAPDETVEAVAGSTRDITERKDAEEAIARRASQLEKLARVANRINSAHDVTSVIGVVTEEARNLLGTHVATTTMMLNPRYRQPITFVSISGKELEQTSQPEVDSLTLFEAFDKTTEPIRLTRSDLADDSRWTKPGKSPCVEPASNGWLAVPLIGRNGTSMGLIHLSGKLDGEFTAEDEDILVQLSQLTSIAIANARLYEELRNNDERKDEFLAMLAHELRNPLAAISNAVNLSLRSKSKEHIDWSFDVIARQMDHLARLIDDLMDVSRITRGKIQLRRDVMDAIPILESAAATVKTLCEERKHTLDLELGRVPLWVNVDPTRLEQVVVNLLNNAAKYSENGGHIWLSSHRDQSDVVISVRDQGLGIPPEKLPEMFEMFAQGDRSLARSEGGLGIGLTVVKKLVEMHGGTITAESKGPGHGSEFIIRLPAAEKPLEAQPSDRMGASATTHHRILVVDDNVDTACGMARLLKVIGHEVATAHAGLEAIEVAKGFRPDFVLLDIGLPGMSGYEVASRMRNEECCRNAVIVAVSGYGQEEDRRRSKDAGFDFHLTKPLDHDALLTLLSAEP